MLVFQGATQAMKFPPGAGGEVDPKAWTVLQNFFENSKNAFWIPTEDEVTYMRKVANAMDELRFKLDLLSQLAKDGDHGAERQMKKFEEVIMKSLPLVEGGTARQKLENLRDAAILTSLPVSSPSFGSFAFLVGSIENYIKSKITSMSEHGQKVLVK